MYISHERTLSLDSTPGWVPLREPTSTQMTLGGRFLMGEVPPYSPRVTLFGALYASASLLTLLPVGGGIRILDPYLPKPWSHFLVSMNITTQTCSKLQFVRMRISRNFTPKFHPFSNLKAQILEICLSAPDSAKKNRAAMKSRDLYYRPKLTFWLGDDLRRRRQIKENRNRRGG